MATAQPGMSKNQVNKAGKIIRRFLRGDLDDVEQFQQAFEKLYAYRAAHQRPLTKANMGLRSMVRTAGCTDVEVTQRLKRITTIMNKLIREPTLALGNMQDVGGCRAVVGSISEIRGVQRRAERTKRVLAQSDYIESPRRTGYRGLHLVVGYDDRAIEIQLRTRVMHEWAMVSERLGEDVKSGDGPQEVHDLMAIISEAMATEECGNVVSHATLAELKQRQELAAPFLSRRRST